MRILPDYEPPSRQMHLLFAPDRRITPKLRSFIDFAVERFAPSAEKIHTGVNSHRTSRGAAAISE